MISVNLSNIRIDGGTQMRADLDEVVVAEYADIIRDGGDFPPVVVFLDGSNHWLGDGFHRFHAYRKAGAIEIPADVREGTKRDAILHAVGANAHHGLRRSPADKRKAVLALLSDDEWSGWSDREIGRQCAVDHKTVGRIREEHLGNSPDDRTVSRGGQTYQQKTANIGKARTGVDPDAASSGDATHIAAPSAETSARPAPAMPTPEAADAMAHERFIAALDALDGIVAADVVAHCPPRQRALICQRASSAIDLLSDIMEGASQ